MNAPLPASPATAKHGMRFGEFVALMAAVIAVNALGIDTMLPALGMIGRELHVSVENHQQLVIIIYLGGFAFGQLLWGPIADRFGRRPILLGAMAVYAAMSFIAAWAGSFELLLAARALQGISSASTRVLSVSIVRDCYSGRHMAKVNSLVFMTFLGVPLFAPTLGQLIILAAPWHWIFYGLGAYALLVALWAWMRLPETLDPADRRPISARAIGSALRQIATNRMSIGYTVAMGFIYSGLVAFLGSSQQIFEHVFHAPQLFAICFAACAMFMIFAALFNARCVERFGMRMISHSALLALILLSGLHLAILLTGHETLVTFVLFNGMSFFCFGLTGSNFSAMAMSPMGHIAGTASSLQGFINTATGSIIGYLIGQAFAGTTLPLTLGWGCNALIALAIILYAERGRLFVARESAAP